MTEQSERPGPSPDPGEAGAGWPPGFTFRRTARTPHSESWDVFGGDRQRIGGVTVQYLPDSGIEGVLALAGDAADDARRGLLAWLTDALGLDAAAGAGGLVHWSTVAGEATDFFRRAPGRRATGAERDLAVVRGRVESVIAQLGLEASTLPDGDLAVDVGSVRVLVAVRLVETAIAVRVFAITNLEVPTDGDLPAYLLSLNFSMAVGRFSLDARNGAVWFDHVLAGEDIDETSLARVVTAVATIADRYDDEIKARYGGRTFRESGSPVEEAARLPAPGGMAGGYL